MRNHQFPPTITQSKVRDEPGPLTAHEAWSLVLPAIQQLESQPRLTFITSGLDISPAGRSFTWEFSILLPTRGVRALVSLGPPEDTEDVDKAPIMLIQRIHAASDADRTPGLPEPFRDSPEVVAELTARGVDFVAGPSDMKLEGRLLASGDAVWITYYWDEEYTASFAAAAG